MPTTVSSPPLLSDARARLESLRARRFAEDDRMVCMERARILERAAAKHGTLDRVPRQAAVLRDLCREISTVIEPEDIFLGRMPEVLPSPDEDRFIAEHPEYFTEPGCPGLLDAMSITIPDWGWLFEVGLDGIVREIGDGTARRVEGQDSEQPAFWEASLSAVASVSLLIRRYAEAARTAAASETSGARRAELEEAAARCDRVAWEAPTSFVDALQLFQIVHMVLSCLVGSRDVTPGRLDQTLLALYRRDLEAGRLTREDAVAYMAMAFLRMSQMGGHALDDDPRARRTPCRYTHLYVTVGGADEAGRPAVNELSEAIADAIRLLRYKEPTLLVRYRSDFPPSFKRTVAALVRDRFPVTIYNDDAVVSALVNNGVAPEAARGYAHSACHNALVPGHDAASGIGGYYNGPAMLLTVLDAMKEDDSFATLWDAFRASVRECLTEARGQVERRWRDQFRDACPLAASVFMRHSVRAGEPAWRSAPLTHYNHYLVGLATVVDSLLAIRALVFEEGMSPADLRAILAGDWQADEALRRRVIARLPRHGDGSEESRAMAHDVCRLWTDEVLRASEGLERLSMWPGFYSHLLHNRLGRDTSATPEGRHAGEALSENMSPSFARRPSAPTEMLREIAALPVDHTPSGASSLTLSTGDLAIDNLLALIEGYFACGGIHTHISCVDAETLEAARDNPDAYASLMVRVAGFSAPFTQLLPDVQEDIIHRHRRDSGGTP